MLLSTLSVYCSGITYVPLPCCSQVGKTKIFLRAGQMAELDARRAEVLGNAARVIQRQFRTWIARKKFRSIRNAAIVLQSFLRGISLRISIRDAVIVSPWFRLFTQNYRAYPLTFSLPPFISILSS